LGHLAQPHAAAPRRALAFHDLSAGQEQAGKVSVALELLFLFTVLTVAPSIVLTMTSYTRIIIVFHFLRQAMGTPQMPPTQILTSLALFMTIIIMGPVIKSVNEDALQPYLDERINQGGAGPGQVPVRACSSTREKDLSIFHHQEERPRSQAGAHHHARGGVPISELKPASPSVSHLHPFLILDMVVASILLSMGMMMLPPAMVASPFKILLFIRSTAGAS
jgi:flagellar biosynthetic protein FliP